MDFFDSHYYRLQKGFLRFCGVWPYQNGRLCIFIRIIFINGIISCVMIPEMIVFLKAINDYDYLMECLPILSGAFMGTTKAIFLIRKVNEVKILLEELQSDWKHHADTKSEIAIIEEYANKGKIISFIYSGLIVFIPTSYYVVCYIPPILDWILPMNETRPRFLMFPGDLYLNAQSNFFIVLHLEFYGFFCASVILLTSDILYMTLMFHTCGMFAILSKKLEELQSYDQKYKIDLVNEKIKLTSDQITYFNVVKCVRLHLKSIKYAELLNSTFNMGFFPDLACGVLLATASAVKFVVSTQHLDDQLRFGLLMCAQSLRIFCNTYPGQLLIDHSSYVHRAVSNSKWYELPEKSKKLLIVLMLRSRRPSEFIVAKIFTMNFQLFSMVFRTCVSYCTVMLSIQDN